MIQLQGSIHACHLYEVCFEVLPHKRLVQGSSGLDLVLGQGPSRLDLELSQRSWRLDLELGFDLSSTLHM